MDLIIPVYLNQRLVFDLVAMSQNGISTVTQISQTQTSSDSESKSVSANFGLSEAFSSLLKIGLSGERLSESAESSHHAASEERVHTPSSLFFSLRRSMLESSVIKSLETDPITYGDFVEFEAALQRSPLTEGLDATTRLLEIAALFAAPQQPKKGQKQQLQTTQMLGKQLKLLSDELKQGGSRDLIASSLPKGYTAVLTVEEQFLSDATMSDIIDGTFRVLGKVVRVFEHPDSSISLLRKTALSHAPDVISKLLAAFDNLDSNAVNLPEMRTEIEGPALQVLPIAVYS